LSRYGEDMHRDRTRTDLERNLTAAVMGLPAEVADSMEKALAEDSRTIRASRYETATGMCPLGAADAYAEARGRGRLEGSATEPGYGGRLLRFAVCFDRCAEAEGIEAALAATRAALVRRTARLALPL
jgi:hypothetical protein